MEVKQWQGVMVVDLKCGGYRLGVLSSSRTHRQLVEPCNYNLAAARKGTHGEGRKLLEEEI